MSGCLINQYASAACSGGLINSALDCTSSLISYANNQNVLNTSTGIITTTGNNAYALGAIGAFSSLTNNGKIETFGVNATAMLFDSQYGGSNITMINRGSIVTHGGNASGMQPMGANATILNIGSIQTEGITADGFAIYNSSSATFDHYGIMRVTGANAHAINVSDSAANTTVNLRPGSIIIGDIYAEPGTTGAKLNLNLGRAASYAYTVNGPWTVRDLDGHALVGNTAYAAATGLQEIASEKLYQTTARLTHGLDTRLRSIMQNNSVRTSPWIDVYYTDTNRTASHQATTLASFNSYQYGLTAGLPLNQWNTPTEIVLNVAQHETSIDQGNLSNNSTQWLAGLFSPALGQVFGGNLFAKILIGMGDHQGNRKLLTNSLLYDGSRQLDSHSHSLYTMVGGGFAKQMALSDRLALDMLIGVDMQSERIASYRETEYFAWHKRTLLQMQTRLQAGLDYRPWYNDTHFFLRAGLESRDLIKGEKQVYSINGVPLTLDTNHNSDEYLTA